MNWQDGEAPDGWTLCALGDVAKVVGGGTPKTSVPGNFSDSQGHPWITPADLTGHTDKYISRGRRFLTDQGLSTSSARYMPAGTVLFSSRAPIGYVAIAANPVTTNQGFRSLVPSDSLDSGYLYHALRYLRPVAEQLASGTTFAELSGTKAARMPIAFPSVEEQRAIAGILDQAEERRRDAVRHLMTARNAIERFRQAVLAAAYAEATDPENGGTDVALSDVLREPLKNGYSARPVSHETPYRVLTLTATTSGWFDERCFKYTEEVFPPDSPFWLEPGDILVQRGNTEEFVGVPALYEGERGRLLYPDLMIRVRAKTDVSPRFLWYMLLAPQSRKYLRVRATGSAGNMPKINQTILAETPVPLAPTGVQEGIVKKLDAAFALCDTIASHADAARRGINRSSQAILAKAFRSGLRWARGGQPE